jgi:rRNA maturation RNase YbeY
VSINFYLEDVTDLRLAKGKLRNWINSAIKEEKKRAGDLNFIFCRDDYLIKINKQYLEHDYYTDIITFDYVDSDVISGDIFISVDRVKENAGIYNVSFSDELNRVIIHGVLHLLGYQDKKTEHRKEMTEKEDYFLSRRMGI